MRRTGKTVGALVEASAHWVDGPAERHVTCGWHFVERALGKHFVERDSGEFWRANGTHKIVQASEPRQRIRSLAIDLLPAPPHGNIRTHVRKRFKPTRGYE